MDANSAAQMIDLYGDDGAPSAAAPPARPAPTSKPLNDAAMMALGGAQGAAGQLTGLNQRMEANTQGMNAAQAPLIKQAQDTMAAPHQAPPQPKPVSTQPPQMTPEMQQDASSWVQAMTVIAGIMGARSQMGATAAFNAFASGMKGFHDGQQEVLKNSLDEWKAKNDAVIEHNKEELDAYKAILEDRKLTEQEQLQAITLAAIPFQNTSFVQAAESKNIQYVAGAYESAAKATMQMAALNDKIYQEGQKNLPSMSPEAINLAAKQLAQGDTAALTNIGRGTQGAANMAAIRNALAAIPGMTGEKMAQIDLNFKRLQSEERTLGTQTAKLATAGTEFDSLADQAVAASEKVDRTQYPSLNAVLEAAQLGTGDENIVQLSAAVNGAANTYARAINPNGTPRLDDARKGLDLLSKAYSKGQIKAAIEQMKRETSASRAAPETVQQDINTQVGGGAPAAQPKAATHRYNPETGTVDAVQ